MPIYIINEAREAPLYHTTTAESALAILKSGVLKPSVPYHDNQVPSNVQGKSCVCFTRSKDYKLTNLTFIQFVFDQAKLSQNYKIASVANIRGDSKSISGFAGTSEPHNAKTFEYEERVLTDKPIPLDKYLIDIRILDGRLARRSIERVLDGSVNDEMYELYGMSKSSNLPFNGFIEYFDKVKSEYGSSSFIEPIYNYNPRIEITDRLDYRYDDRVKAYIPEDEYSYLTKYNNIVLNSSIHDILDSDTRIPNLTIEELKPYIVDIQFSNRVDEEFVQSVYDKVRNSDITEVDHLMYDAGSDYSGDKKGIARLVAMIYGLGLPCSILEDKSNATEETDDMPIDATTNEEDRVVYTGPLFHCTAARNAVLIIESNSLKGNYFPEVYETEPYICFTTNPDYLFEEGNTEIRFEFDASKLSKDYKLEDYKDVSVTMEQYEKRIYTDLVPNMMDYVINIEIINEGRDTIPKALNREYILGLEDLENYSGDNDQIRILQLVMNSGKSGSTFLEVFDALENYYVEELEIPERPEVLLGSEFYDPQSDGGESPDMDNSELSLELVEDMFGEMGYEVDFSELPNIKAIKTVNSTPISDEKVEIIITENGVVLRLIGRDLETVPGLMSALYNIGTPDLVRVSNNIYQGYLEKLPNEDTEDFIDRVGEFLDSLEFELLDNRDYEIEEPKVDKPKFITVDRISDLLDGKGFIIDDTLDSEVTAHKDELEVIVSIVMSSVKFNYTGDDEAKIENLCEYHGFLQMHTPLGTSVSKNVTNITLVDEVDKLVDDHLKAVLTPVPEPVDEPEDAEEVPDEPEEVADPDEVPEEAINPLDDAEEFLRTMENRKDFKKLNDTKYKYIESNEDYDFIVEFDDEFDVVYFTVDCSDKDETEFINRVMGNAYKFNGYTGNSTMTVQMDLGDLNKMIDGQVSKFDKLVDDVTGQSSTRTTHAISAELVAKPQKDKNQEAAAKRLENFVRTVLAPLVDSDDEWNSFFLDTPKEFKKYRIRTVGIMLTCYDMKSSKSKLEQHPIYKKMNKARKVVRQRGWQKSIDPDGNKCYMCIFIDAEYAKEFGRDLLDESIELDGETYTVREVCGLGVILECGEQVRIVSITDLLS